MKGFGEKNQSKKEITSKNKQKVNIGQLIKKAFELQSQGKKLEAAKYYQYLIKEGTKDCSCLLYTSPSPRDRQKSRMPSSA